MQLFLTVLKAMKMKQSENAAALYSDFAAVYDRLTENVDYGEMASRTISILKHNGILKGTILDLACGTGNLIKSLAKKEPNYDFIGVDSSEEMLIKAQDKLMETELDTLLLHQKMEELDLYGTVKAAVSTLDSVNHLTEPCDIYKAFNRLSLFIPPDGLFIFDVNTEYKHINVLSDNTFIYDIDDVYCVWQNKTDINTLETEMSLDIFAENKGGLYSRFYEEFKERAFSDEFLTDALSKNEFDVIARYDGYKDKSPSKYTERVLYIAKRR
jgi:ubiquinone/menaquinone biosynthesis C-methylase UbiE